MRRTQRSDSAGAKRLSAVARRADADERRNHLREVLDQPRGAERTAELRRLTKEIDVEKWPAVSINLLGRALLDAEDAEAAEKIFRQGQRRNSGDVWLNYNLAVCLEKLRRREEAIRYYAVARAIRPETAHELAHALRDEGEKDEAIAVFAELSRAPENGRHLLCWGTSLLAEGRSSEVAKVLDAGIAACRERIRLKPEDTTGHFYLGSILSYVKRDYDGAVTEFREAIRLAPNNPNARLNLGDALISLGKLTEAAGVYREAIHVWPQIGRFYVGLADVLEAQGKQAEATAAYREATRLGPDDATIRANFGVFLSHKRRDYDGAIAEYRAAIRVVPKNPDYHINLGAILCDKKKDYEGAIVEFREAIRLNPKLEYAHRNLGVALKLQGRLAEAIVEFREAIQLKPDDANAHYDLGVALRVHGKLEEAIAEDRVAIRLKPDHVDAHNELGFALQQLG